MRLRNAVRDAPIAPLFVVIISLDGNGSGLKSRGRQIGISNRSPFSSSIKFKLPLDPETPGVSEKGALVLRAFRRQKGAKPKAKPNETMKIIKDK